VSRTVLLAGGGTGGHVFPSLAVADALARAGVRVAFVGTARGLESRLVPEAGWPLHEIEMLPLARRLSPSLARLPLVLVRAARQVARLLRDEDVAAAAVFGGYVSLPLAVAAWRTGTPYVVHEQNAVPGLANRLAVRRAAAVAATFPSSVGRFGRGVAVEVTGNPVRPGLGRADRRAALAEFGLEEGRRTLLVFGGSQGARRLNQAAIDALGRWADPERLQLLHLTGRTAFAEVDRAWEEALRGTAGPVPLVRRVDFVDRMELAYAAADLAVCRSGASTIAELTVLGVPSVLVPYPHATAGHQQANAEDLAAAGGAVVVDDAELDGTALVAAAEPLLADPAQCGRMAAAARAFASPDAARRVAALILRAAGLPLPAPTSESSR
jgi:UDP-N-acetylglucosamine--N-acetylmuramyl-(pentapeptide) pyrophosphoryl-undecaprenol N-acetylglucosamine transferase